jgi:hypothetical protein
MAQLAEGKREPTPTFPYPLPPPSSFQEFARLHEDLVTGRISANPDTVRRAQDAVADVVFPPRVFFSLQPEVVRERQVGLQRFLHVLAGKLMHLKEVRAFLQTA